MAIEEKDIECVANRSVVYAYLTRLFESEPSQPMVEAFCQTEKLAAYVGAHETLRPLCDEMQQFFAEHEDALSLLEGDYNRLFVGPMALPAKPWECVYRTGRPEILQESTLEVRRFYAACGYQAKNKGKVSDDSLALELQFVHALADKALQALSEENEGEALRLLGLQRQFLEEHLNFWAGKYARDVAESKNTTHSTLYQNGAQVVAEFCAADLAWLKSLK